MILSTRTNADPTELLLKLYATPFINYHGTDYTIGHLFGATFRHEQNLRQHSNWIQRQFESVFNPVVGRALCQRPTFARCNLETYETELGTTVNPYLYLTSLEAANVDVLTPYITSISSYLKSNHLATTTIGELFPKCSGITVMNHSIEPVTLPTWHHLPQAILSKDENPEIAPISDKKFAELLNFLVPHKITKSVTYAYPTVQEEILPALYLVEKGKKYNSKTDPMKNITFDPRCHVTPDVLWYQP